MNRGPQEKEENKPPCGESQPQRYRIMLEPALVGAMIAINLGQTSLQNFYLQTACTIDLGMDLEVCEKGEMEVTLSTNSNFSLMHFLLLQRV